MTTFEGLMRCASIISRMSGIEGNTLPKRVDAMQYWLTEEEVLAAKLILEHREPWLRNEATMLSCNSSVLVFKNPFGDVNDGVPDANFTSRLGVSLLRELGIAHA